MSQILYKSYYFLPYLPHYQDYLYILFNQLLSQVLDRHITIRKIEKISTKVGEMSKEKQEMSKQKFKTYFKIMGHGCTALYYRVDDTGLPQGSLRTDGGAISLFYSDFN